jgi:hypothetical protein
MEQERIPALKEVGEMIKDFGENLGNFKECVACAKNLGNLLENSVYSDSTFSKFTTISYCLLPLVVRNRYCKFGQKWRDPN